MGSTLRVATQSLHIRMEESLPTPMTPTGYLPTTSNSNPTTPTPNLMDSDEVSMCLDPDFDPRSLKPTPVPLPYARGSKASDQVAFVVENLLTPGVHAVARA